MQLLFVEDDEMAISPIKQHLERASHDCQVVPFGIAEETIKNREPDVVILDLAEDLASGDKSFPGVDTFDFIWKNRFCPILVYSALPEHLDDKYTNNPFVAIIKKGRDTEGAVEQAISEFGPHVEALRDAETYFKQQAAAALRAVATLVFKNVENVPDRNEVIVRLGRRRLAALIDDSIWDGQPPASWEQYVCPPVSSHLLTGDVLFRVAGMKNNPSDFRIVLTPSCDLAPVGQQAAPRVQEALVACCEEIDATIDFPKSPDKLITKVLTQGYVGSAIPFPELRTHIPHMAANLRDLELISLDNIEKDDAGFKRIASVDSPYREVISWAYMQSACRPGLPERNLTGWAEEIQLHIEAKKADEEQA